MSEVNRTEATAFLRELREFAYQGNHDFRIGRVAGVEMEKGFVFPSKPIESPNGGSETPYKRTIVGMKAARLGKINNRYLYDYSVYATSERSIPRIPDHIMGEIVSETYESATKHLIEDIDEDSADVTEATSTIFEAADDEVDEIHVNQDYKVLVNGDEIYSQDTDSIFYKKPGEFIAVPAREFYDPDTTQYFVEQPLVEKLPGKPEMPFDERILSEIAYRAILDPFMYSEYRAVIGFHDAAGRIRAILDVLQNGSNVGRLYDEVE
jgi:hypothetical protein